MINVFLFFLVIVAYYRKRPDFVLLLLWMMSNAFALFETTGGPLRPEFLQFMAVMLITIREWSGSPNYFKSQDSVSLSLLCMLGVLTLCTVGTLILGIDSFKWGTTTIRGYSLLLLYFYFRRQDFSFAVSLFKICLLLSTLQGILYLLQFVGVDGILVGEYDDIGTDTMVRYRNQPLFALLFFTFFCIKEGDIYKRLFYIVLFGLCMILCQWRAQMMCAGLSVAFYYIIKGDKRVVYYVIGALVVYQLLIAQIFEYREGNNSLSTIEELKMVLTDPLSTFDLYTSREAGGTFMFRIAMLMERINFLVDNPTYLPLGVGTIDEYSPANRFYFMLGTSNNSALYGHTMLTSADIEWISVIMRAGIVGIFVFVYFLLSWCLSAIKVLRVVRDPIVAAVSSLSVGMTIMTFNCSVFNYLWLIIVLSISVLYMHNSQKLT